MKFTFFLEQSSVACLNPDSVYLISCYLSTIIFFHATSFLPCQCYWYWNYSLLNQVWDLGGQESLRTSWATYYRGTHAVIVVIDSTDRARINIIKDELFRLLQHGDLEGAVVLVFANKQDLKDAMSPAEITDALSLHSIKNHDWHIQASCAITGEGLYDGLGWIAQKVAGKATTSWPIAPVFPWICWSWQVVFVIAAATTSVFIYVSHVWKKPCLYSLPIWNIKDQICAQSTTSCSIFFPSYSLVIYTHHFLMRNSRNSEFWYFCILLKNFI